VNAGLFGSRWHTILFTCAVLIVSILTVLAWSALFLFRDSIFRFFGANDDILPKTIEYGSWIVWFMPAFVFTIFISLIYKVRSNQTVAWLFFCVLFGLISLPS
jgi:Na+-driven multidrug efflux pump